MKCEYRKRRDQYCNVMSRLIGMFGCCGFVCNCNEDGCFVNEGFSKLFIFKRI